MWFLENMNPSLKTFFMSPGLTLKWWKINSKVDLCVKLSIQIFLQLSEKYVGNKLRQTFFINLYDETFFASTEYEEMRWIFPPRYIDALIINKQPRMTGPGAGMTFEFYQLSPSRDNHNEPGCCQHYFLAPPLLGVSLLLDSKHKSLHWAARHSAIGGINR